MIKVKIDLKEEIIISSFSKEDLDSFIQIHVEHLFSDGRFSGFTSLKDLNIYSNFEMQLQFVQRYSW